MHPTAQMWVLVSLGFLLYGFASIFISEEKIQEIIKGIAGIMIFSPLAAVTHLVNTKPEIVSHTDTMIYSTAGPSSNLVNGTFFLGSGTINTEEVYLGNIFTPDNGLERIYIPVRSVIRYADKNLTDFAVYRKLYCRSKNILVYTDITHCYDMDHSIKDKLFIPKNSVIKQLRFQ